MVMQERSFDQDLDSISASLSPEGDPYLFNVAAESLFPDPDGALHCLPQSSHCPTKNGCKQDQALRHSPPIARVLEHRSIRQAAARANERLVSQTGFVDGEGTAVNLSVWR
jgi:hypothetical protein